MTKKRKAEDEEEKEEEKEEGEVVEVEEDMPEPPDMESPPGVKTRSVRKKRRRDEEDMDDSKRSKKSEATEDEEMKDAEDTKEPAGDDDHSVRTTGSVAETIDTAHAAAATTTTDPDPTLGNAVRLSPSKHVATRAKGDPQKDRKSKIPAPKLHLPAKTPGKTTEKNKKKPPTAVPTQNAGPRMLFPEDVLLPAQQQEEPPTQQEQVEEVAPSLWEQSVDLLTSLVVGTPPGQHIADDGDEEIVEAPPPPQRTGFSCKVWFGLIFVLHGVFWPLTINPGLDMVSRSSKPLTVFYKGLWEEYTLKSVALPGENVEPTLAANQNFTFEEAHELLERTKTECQQELNSFYEKLANVRDALSVDDSASASLLTALREESTNRASDIHKRRKELHQLQSLVDALNMSNPDSVKALQNALGSRKDLVVDVSQFQSFEVPDCKVPPRPADSLDTNLPEIPDDAIHQSQVLPEVEKALEELGKLDDRAEAMVWEWLEPFALQKFEEDKAALALAVDSTKASALHAQQQANSAITASSSPKTGLPPVTGDTDLSAYRAFIQGRLDVDAADGTGRFDFASLSNGAKIVREATTPSLVDELPLFNRLAALWGLKFYGYGPEAALGPPQTPGYCWSFTRHPSNMAAYGLLTVELATGEEEGITVDSLILEHNGDPRNAARSFNILGYIDTKGRSQHLGSFEFERGKMRQSFHISPDQPLRAIALAIDSNWGGDYICLYRLRVHGDNF